MKKSTVILSAVLAFAVVVIVILGVSSIATQHSLASMTHNRDAVASQLEGAQTQATNCKAEAGFLRQGAISLAGALKSIVNDDYATATDQLDAANVAIPKANDAGCK